jgi:hypothetical protein
MLFKGAWEGKTGRPKRVNLSQGSCKEVTDGRSKTTLKESPF